MISNNKRVNALPRYLQAQSANGIRRHTPQSHGAPFQIRCVLKTSDNMPLSPLMGHLHAQSSDGIRQVLFKCALFNLKSFRMLLSVETCNFITSQHSMIY